MSQQPSRRRRRERAPDPVARARRAERHSRLLADGLLAVAGELPIADHADELVAAIRDHQVVVVAGETGSGKSTQLPKLCLAAGRGIDGLIGHTQPRRVAARSIAGRLADELAVPLGDAVGFAVRFTDAVGPDTLVKVMTDGILLAEIQRDPLLRRYDTLIIDEAHERSLNIDFLIGYLAQLLPRRPDLKLIITSATIDTARFAEHFATAGVPAPIVTVSGRTYPVEIRYRPLGGDGSGDAPATTDQVQAIVDAIDEIERDGPGDVLVFLSGEREIHDTADVLRRRPAGRHPLDVVPMYARLSAAEQQKIFRSPPAGHRRVVLSTNVAETSLTVPGIRYVIDTGLARISRYSRRLKVQRLPIEPISQASADQRAGRCGRIGPGVAIRLYSEEDFDARDEFTEPEILRTNLAAVILQMTAIGLGDIESFPFLEPPDRALIGDGFRLLDELGALHRDEADGRAGRQLTAVGRQLARLPVDPRLGRMIIEADRLDCVREVLVIASALSIQDPRERPLDRQQLADEAHKRFAVAGSDLLGIVALWDYIRGRQRELSGNQFRRLCQREYLHYVRTREWQDLYSQLRQIAGQLGIRPSTTSAHPDHVHQAVLAGLLSHLGMRDGDSREFRGARGSTFVIGRGSVLTRKPPRWVVAAELVETERLFARRVATVQPQWAERLAGDLAKYSYGEARWDAPAGRATTIESVSLFGLPIVSGRTVGLDRIDPALARQLFIRNVLVDPDPDPAPGDGSEPGAGDTRPPRRPADTAFLRRNRQFARDVHALEERLRSHHLLDLDTIHDAYERRIPHDVTTVAAFDAWWKRTMARQPELLDLTVADLNDPRGAAIDLDAFPDRWPYGDIELPLRYRFDPDSPLDGVTVEVGVAVINQLAGAAFDWHIPGFRSELLATLARSLPKAVRRELIPLSDTVAAAGALLGEPDGPLLDAFAAALTQVSGVAVRPDDFDAASSTTHLRVHFVVRDGDGAVLDAGDDLAQLRHRLAGAARAEIAAAVPIVERSGILTWDLGDLPETVSAERGGHVVRGYPALVDDGDSVSLRVFSNPELQRRVMRAGVRRLLLLEALPSTAAAERSIAPVAALAAGVPLAELGEQSAIAAVDVIVGKRPLPFTADAFTAIADAVRERGDALAAAVLRHAVDAAGEARRARRALAGLGAPGFLTSVADATRQLDRLAEGRFVVRAGAARIADVVRYLQALNHRLERLRHDVGSDRRRMLEVQPLEAAYTDYLASLGSQPASADAVDLGWQLEELRVAVFAQRQGTRNNVSPTRIRRHLDRLVAANR